MVNPENPVTCQWLTPTRLMPYPYGFDEKAKPWSCIRDGCPRPLTPSELRECATCPRWELRTFDATRRDLVFEAWGTGIVVPEPTAFDDVKRALVLEAWGVGSN
jgi:hypothetical protein